jgi:hypothetical protein
MLRIADDAVGVPASVGKFVAGRCSPNTQRRANKRRSNAAARILVGGHGHAIRMVDETAGGRIGCSRHPLLAPRRRSFAQPDFRLTINSPNDDGTTNSSSVRARLKPLKTLA